MDRVSGVGDWTLHDLRRTAATRMTARGVPGHIAELILNHGSKPVSAVAAIYNRYDYAPEKRRALQTLADDVVQVVTDAPSLGYRACA